MIMIFTIISKLLGFLRDITLSYFFGAGDISDVYLISTTIPLTVFAFIGTGLVTNFIPLYGEIEKEISKKRADVFTRNLINAVAIIAIILIFLCYIFAEPIVQLFATGFRGEVLDLAVSFTKISVVSMFFSGVIFILIGYLQIKGNFIIPALIGIPLSIITMLSFVLGYKISIYFLPIGIIFASIVQLFFIIPFTGKFGYKHELKLGFKDAYLKKILLLSIPVSAGISINQINVLVDRTLASQIAVGGVSALSYANRLNGFVQGIFVLSIATVIFPLISKAASEKDKKFFKIVSGAIVSMTLFIIPISIGTMIFSIEITQFLFGRGAFDNNAVLLTSTALFFYSIGMIGIGLREILSRVFYSMQDTKIPVINSAIGMSLNIILNIVLSKFLGIGGLALATSIAAMFTTTLLFISLRKKIGPFGMKQISISFLKILFASLVMGGLAKLSFNYLTSSISQNLSLLIAIGVGAISYFVIIYFMKIEDVDVIVGVIKKKLGRGAA